MRARLVSPVNTGGGSWKISISGDKEPGEPLIVSGTIYAPDGRMPVEGINLYVYQTDSTGVYSTTGSNQRNTRLHGMMRSNKEGRYEFRTIKPGSYPGSTNPAHIHAYISGPGYPEYWIDEYHFEDDRFISDEDKAKSVGPRIVLISAEVDARERRHSARRARHQTATKELTAKRHIGTK